VRWAWLDWGLSVWLTTLLQCFDTVDWVIRPVKHHHDLNCIKCDIKTFWRSLLQYGYSYKASCARPGWVVICNFWHMATVMLSFGCQSAWMSKITNDDLTRSGTGSCFIAVPMATVGVKRLYLTQLNRGKLCNFWHPGTLWLAVCRSSRGFMHMKIVTDMTSDTGSTRFILGQFSQPFTSIPQMIHHYSVSKLPVKGAEHTCLLYPVSHELLWVTTDSAVLMSYRPIFYTE